MVERFLVQTSFVSDEDFQEHLQFKIPPHFNFAYDVMDVWAAEQPQAMAMLWTNEYGQRRMYTFADMKKLSDQTAAYFQTIGIGRGDTVMLILKRRVEFWLSMLALHKLGAVPIPATHMLTQHDIVYRNQRADVKAIVCVDDVYVVGQVNASLDQSPSVKAVVVVDEGVRPFRPFSHTFHSWSEEWGQAPMFKRPETVNSNDDTMMLYFTSGTNGEPKMVAHNFIYPLGHITTGVFWHNLRPGSIHLTVADTGWAKCAWGKLYGQWLAGAAVFVFDHEKFRADRLLRVIERERITSLCAPPTVYRFLIREDLSKYDLSSLEYCTTAGEALNPSVFDDFKKHTGLQLMEGFGQTETTMTLGTMPWTRPKPGSMGKPNPQYDIALHRPDGTPCDDGEKGEIVIRTENGAPIGLFKEYYRDEELTRRVWHDGYYHTGDLAWRDDDGYYWFEGRIDDVIKSSGYRIGPFEVESALMRHPAVVECAITGVPDEVRGMVVKATVVLAHAWKAKAGDELVKELQHHCKSVTAPYKYPRIIEFVDELPKTISGKIRRVEIRENDKTKIEKK